MTNTLPEQLTQLQETIQADAQFADQLEEQLRMHHANRQEVNNSEMVTIDAQFNRIASMVATLVIMILVLAMLPPVQTLAMNILNGLFNRADTNEMTVTRPQTDSASRESEDIPIEQLASVANFDLQFPNAIPSIYTLRDSGYFEDRNTVTLSYDAPGRGLIITQQPLASVDYGLLTDGGSGIGVDAPITPVMVGDFAGEYVIGAWIVEDQQINEDGTVTTQVIWNETVSMRTLRWIEGDVIFEIRAMGGSEGHRYIGLEEMIEIALSME
ncbi:MAG: hypothetical protein AAF846_06190 [Chloroflexota bacterium]